MSDSRDTQDDFDREAEIEAILRRLSKRGAVRNTLGQEVGTVSEGGLIRDNVGRDIGFMSGRTMYDTFGREISSIGLDGTLRSPLGNPLGRIGL